MSAKFAFSVFVVKNCTPAISFERFNVYSSINFANVKSGQERGIKVAILLLLHWYTSIIVILLSKYNLHFCFELLETYRYLKNLVPPIKFYTLNID